MSKAIKHIQIHKYKDQTIAAQEDAIAIEEPLEISLAYIDEQQVLCFKNISITMRTPGHDPELALGFLYNEQIIKQYADLDHIETKGENKICIFLKSGVHWDKQSIQRNFYTTSSCGVCGKASIEAIQRIEHAVTYPKALHIHQSIIPQLAQQLQKQQAVFQQTGGLHAATLFDATGQLLALFEDVGRHNALDKLIGHYFSAGQLPLHQHLLLLSGRASFELIQKAVMAGIQFVCAIGAPSSLAIELAQEYDLCLLGFVRPNSFNVYSGIEKLVFD